MSKNVQKYLCYLGIFFISKIYRKLETKKLPKYCCNLCDFKCSKPSNYNEHIKTKKHLSKLAGNAEDNDKKYEYSCNCGKIYTSKSGLWKHKKTCELNNSEDKQIINNLLNSADIGNLIQYLMKENSEFKQLLINQSSQMVEITKNVGNNNSNNSHNTNMNNSNNKHFNLQFFLNETCKDAMNIDEFVSSIKVNLEDLEHTGKTGYVEGISNIFIKNLNSIEQHLRPLHCSDMKREVIYIKNNDEWIKEKEEKPILTKAIKAIANENIKQIPIWKELHPGCTLSDSKKNNTYLNILSNSMCGTSDDNIVANMRKIISKISKVSSIDKEYLITI